MNDDADAGAALEGLSEERQSVHLYQALAAIETDPVISAMFTQLAKAADAQAGMWSERLRETGVAVPATSGLGLRPRMVLWLASRIGIRPVRGMLAALKVRGLSAYSAMPVGGHPRAGSVDEIGRRHRSTGGGNLRAAVFGVNDGLVSNAALILGMAGADASMHNLVLAGFAGLLGGAFSMAAGEYVSVRSQREVYEYQIGLERAELAEYPQAEADELATIYAAKGIAPAEARRIAQALIAEPERALDTLAREELGLNPDELGSPWQAASSSFVAFAIGAAVPLLPLLFVRGQAAFAVAIGCASATLFGVGALLSWFTGRNAWASGARMLAIGASAGLATWLLGRLAGTTLG